MRTTRSRSLWVLQVVPTMFMLFGILSFGRAVEVPCPPRYNSNAEWWQYQFDGYQPDFTNNNCGPACAAMVINYLKDRGVTTTYKALISSAYPNVHCQARWNYCRGNGHPEGFANSDWSVPGATTAEIQYALSVEGIQSHTFTGYDCENDGTGLRNLEDAIDQGKVCIALVDPSCYRSTTCHSHWAVVYGYDDSHVYLNDPGYQTGQAFRATRADFADAIWLVTELSVVIVCDTKVTEEILQVSLSAAPSSGQCPLSGVDLTATVSGTATGSINYTFYSNRADDETNVTYPNSFKIEHINADGTDGEVITWGTATDYSGGTTFTVYDVCNYAEPGSYWAKVIAERGTKQAQARIEIIVAGTVATPVFVPVPGTYASAQNVTITSVPSDAVIHYTLDGSTPTEGSPLYSSPVSISQTTTLKARAFKSGWNPSDVASGTYTIAPPAFSATRSFRPAFYTSPGTVDVSIEISYGGSDVPSAFVIVESIPVGWSFNCLVSCWAPPLICPQPGAESVALGWLEVADFPAVVTYRLNVPAGESGTKTFLGLGGATTTAGQANFAIGGDQTIGPGISGISVDPDTGDFVLSWEGEAGKGYQVEASEDLEVWYAASNVVVPTADGPVSWRDSDSVGFPRRFYRLLLLTD